MRKTSILKLQTHRKSNLRHLEWYGRRNESTLKLEVHAKFGLAHAE